MIDNKCTCEHGFATHMSNGKLGACTYNQRICDCYEYVPRKVDNHEIFDLQINFKENGMRKREYVKMDPEEKLKIVAQVEARLGSIIIDPFRTQCLEDCRCHGCFQKALDELVTKTEQGVLI